MFVLLCKIFHDVSLSGEKEARIIEAVNSTSRYFDELLNIDNTYFDRLIN